MKTTLFLTAAIAAAALSAPAFAEVNASVGYSAFDIGSTNLNAISGRVGWTGGLDPAAGQGELSFGIEGEAAFGLGEEVTGSGVTRNASKLKSEIGVFGTLTAAMDSVSVNARLGYANIDVRNTSGTGLTATSSSYSEGGLAYGVGAAWNINETSGLRVDYTHYDVAVCRRPAVGPTPAFPGHAANAWTVSYVRNFR